LYFDFYVDNNLKLGKFRVNQNMPTFHSVPKQKNTDKDATCMDKTDNFGDCMLCGINECGHDWICAVVCAIAASECLAGFAISCAID
jgi:hypothetical protein